MRSMVEGQSGLGACNDAADDGAGIFKHIACGNAQSNDPDPVEPSVPRCISVRPISSLMRFAIDLDRQPRIGAEEIQNEGAAWMLTAKLEAMRSGAQCLPEKHFRQRHFSAEVARLANGSRTALWCNVLEHRLPLHHASHGPPPRGKLGEELEER